MGQQEETVEQFKAILQKAMENVTLAMNKLQEEEPDYGLMTAYAALLLMAIIPIYVGAHNSVKTEEEKKKEREENEAPDVMTHKDAYYFPFYASGALITLYVLFKFFGKEYINLLLGGYFFLLGVTSLTISLRPFLAPLLPSALQKRKFSFNLTSTNVDKPDDKEEMFKQQFDYVDIACLAVSLGIGAWYLMTKHWIANNLFGLSFSVEGVALLQLGSFQIGAILLGGLFVYDIFWVFGTDVMVTVAKSFDAPIKVIFPKDIWINGPLAAKDFAMLGLGDIVIPGILIALLLRFDISRKTGSKLYFWATYLAYIAGLVTTILVMHVFKAAQPALLYLVPACLLTPLTISVLCGHTAQLLKYHDEPEEEKAEGEKDDKKSK